MIDDAKVLIKLMKAGTSPHIIAAKLGISVDEVKRRWADLQILAQEASGHGDLVMQYNLLCHQYQLLGESLKIVAKALGNAVPPHELREMIVPGDVDLTFKNLTEKCIILKSFAPQDPEESLRVHLKRTAEGN